MRFVSVDCCCLVGVTAAVHPWAFEVRGYGFNSPPRHGDKLANFDWLSCAGCRYLWGIQSWQFVAVIIRLIRSIRIIRDGQKTFISAHQSFLRLPSRMFAGKVPEVTTKEVEHH